MRCVLKLAAKLLLGFFLSTLLAIVVLVALMQTGLRQGYNSLIVQSEIERIRIIEGRLLDFFATEGSWDRLRIDRDLRYAVTGIEEAAGRPDLPADPPAIGAVARRTSLYDPDKRVVFGRQSIAENPIQRPLEFRNELVGYVGLVPIRSLEDGPDAAFLSRQLLTGVGAGAVVLLCALTVAHLLSRRILSPIRQLTEGTARLRAGHYDRELDVTGNDELTRLCEDFNELARTLKKNEHDRHQWTTDIAHELRTPVTVLQSQLEAIRDGVFEVEPERLAFLSGETERISRLIDDLYQLSLAESGQLSCRKTNVDPLPLLNQSINSFQPACTKKTIDVRLASSLEGPARIFADSDRLLQVFTNILQNSCRYTDAGGRIDVRVSENDKEVIIVFEDSEPGVSDAELTLLFDRLYRVEKSRSRRHGGAGLGLALCKAIVTTHGGGIRAFHSVLGGVGIECTFPKAGAT